ncbi:nucleosome binding factor SPN SPT16 subunit [Streptomyces sp. V2I9]|nr:nucleosome binding factor SPN SPT16 subunit [Streptomyces sp. V2I9]
MGRTRAQAADVLLDEAGAEADDEEEADDDALAFVSEPDDEDDVESDDFEDVDAGVLLDEEPRLSFR